MTVDPGLQGTGYAVWRRDRLSAVGVITPPRKGEWWDRAHYVAQNLRAILGMGDRVYVEHMEYFGGAKSMGWRTGDLQRTTYLEGCIAGSWAQSITIPVPVRDWKGQLPKDVVIARAKMALGTKQCQELGIETHAWDAVGIGLWVQNRL